MKKSFILFIPVCVWMHAPAQTLDPNVVATTGGFDSNVSGTLSWTLGEPVTETVADGQSILTQGFQQPELQITAVTAVESDVTLNVFPNPASEMIHLSFSNQGQSHAFVELFTTEGRLVYSELAVLNGGDTQLSIDVQHLAAGMYMLKITLSGETAPRIFKVQKIK
jgi:hypothetical protein